MAFVFAAAAVAWGLFALKSLIDIAEIPLLPPLDDEQGIARVSIVIAARDEALRIGRTLERLLEQRGVDLELIVVDDRSSDATGAIVSEVAARDPRVHLITVGALPAGWLGKTHACQLGASAASGEWLLFTDGDVWIGPDVIARAVAAAHRADVRHLVIAPNSGPASLPARAATATFGGALAGSMAAVNRDSRFLHVGIGAFNLIGRDAWLAIGGHQKLALEVVDDMRMGQLLCKAGFRTRAFFTRHEVEADWARTVWGMVRGLEKNFFAELGYSLPIALYLFVFFSTLWLAAVIGPFTGTTAGFAAAIAGYSIVIPGIVGARKTGVPIIVALLMPFFGWMLPCALANSTWKTLRRGGVRWRGTLYPLAELRAARKRSR